ncbi:MAG: cytochrome c biogenesis protein CcsA [Acidobacteriota bacterium]
MTLRRWTVALWALAFVTNAAALGLIFGYAPIERQMGAVQKIFYYHVPSAISGYVLLFLAFLFSILFLWKDEPLYDTLAYSSAEVGWIFITIVLVTGPIWGRSAWGKWWVWEPRLTSALVLWLMYSAYFLLRLFSRNDARTARIAAVVAIIAFFDVPIVHKAISWWGSIVHPVKVTLEPAMRKTFFVSMLAVFVLAAAFLATRIGVALAEEAKLQREGGR